MAIRSRASGKGLLGALAGCFGLGSCLSLLAVAVVVIGFVGGILFLVTGSFKSSPVYERALVAAQSDPRVSQALGTPIQPGWFITGSISERGLSGDADLVIPISGPRKSGTLYASARKGNGVWQFYTLAVQVDGQDGVIPLEY